MPGAMVTVLYPTGVVTAACETAAKAQKSANEVIGFMTSLGLGVGSEGVEKKPPRAVTLVSPGPGAADPTEFQR